MWSITRLISQILLQFVQHYLIDVGGGNAFDAQAG